MDLLVVTAGRTGPNKALRFGGDASLDEAGRRRVAALAIEVGARPIVAGPEAATRQSAELLGPDVRVDDSLRTLDVGRWAGHAPDEVDPDDLAVWFGDPASCPHGGESIAAFVERITLWHRTFAETADARAASCVVVAMPVAQALLAGDAASFFGIEVAPATVYRLPRATG
ncbi:histidine phosphatase family protein [Gordonia sp. DT30]|uniref:histidine phosphatase family protein n=1 Tax=unclassified Gordonia (in: high G+C Gram-positive bacteria) TaxID=2657482 RepID=UPI003CFAEAA6